jgi:hypothetical protein
MTDTKSLSKGNGWLFPKGNTLVKPFDELTSQAAKAGQCKGSRRLPNNRDCDIFLLTTS